MIDQPNPTSTIPRLARIDWIALTAVAVTGLMLVAGPQLAFCLAVGLLVVLFLVRYPVYLLPLLVVTYPLEFSKLFFPFLLLEKTTDGSSVSIVDLFRLIALLTIVIVGLASIGKRSRPQARNVVTTVLPLLAVYYGFSAAFVASGPGKPVVEFARLVFHVLLFFAVMRLTNSIARMQTIFKAVIYTGFTIGLLGILQLLTGWHLWTSDLGAGTSRVNVTFKDANLLARFMLMTIAVVFCTRQHLRLPPFVAILTGPICLLTLIATSSRGGVIGLVCVVALFWMYGIWKAKVKTILALGCWLIVGVAFLLLNQSVLARLQTLSSGTDALGVRLALMATAVQIFFDHPIFGAGIGMFRLIATQEYAFLLPYAGTSITESHTAILTIASELGAVGLFVVGWLVHSLWRSIRTIARESTVWPYAIAAWMVILVLLISSQSEGRLLEDPMLYIMSAVVVAAYRMHRSEAREKARLQQQASLETV